MYYPHRFSVRGEDDAGVQELAKTAVLSCLDVINKRLARGCGPYLLGNRFSLADFYLSFWVADLDQDQVRKRCPKIARLYESVRARPTATPYLQQSERVAREWADMMRKSTTPLIG